METNFFDVTELVENNKVYLLFRMTGPSEDLIRTGVLSGKELMIRVSRNDDETITVFNNDGSDYAWTRHTRVTDIMSDRRRAIMLCINFRYMMPLHLDGAEWPLQITGKDSIPEEPREIRVWASGAPLFNDGVIDRSALAVFHMDGARRALGFYRVGDVLDTLGDGFTLVPDDAYGKAARIVLRDEESASFKCPVCGGTELVNIVHGDVVCPVKNISVVDGDIDYDTSSVDWQKSDVDDLGCECAACHTHFNSVEAALAGNVKQD